MKKSFLLFLCIIFFIAGCSVQSTIRKSIEIIYQASVDERSVSHIIEDKKLSSLMMAELIKDDVTNLLDITAVCYFGYPFVVGQCNTVDEAERAIEIAKEVTGKSPIPYLIKKGVEADCNPALDLAISTEVTARLVADKKIFATNVVVKSIQCEVVLLGVLGSKESILAAIEHANKVNGVKKIRSFLVSTDTGRSWDSVFKSMGEMTKGSGNTVIINDGNPQPSVKKEEPPTTEENSSPQ